MNSLTDQQLLRDYSGLRTEAAFAELARRHVDFVYSAALRMVRDTHLAEDVTQAVFVALSKNATQLADRPVLSGWLHRTTQNLAANTVRSEVRRRVREQEAFAMNELLANENDAAWENIAPHLDAALGELSESDRDALLLRYFERKSAREMALTLNVSEEAAQKRVSRAVERLREFFSKRNVTVGASGLVVLISANAVQAAPIGLIATVSTAVSFAGTALQTSTAIAATKTIVMTTLQKTLTGAVLTVAIGTVLYETKQNSLLNQETESLRQQQTELSGHMENLKQENMRLSNLLAQTETPNKPPKDVFSDLLKVRGVANVSRAKISELEEALSNQTEKLPATVATILTKYLDSYTAGEKQFQENDALNKLEKMSAHLKLTPDQQRQIQEILMANVDARTKLEVAASTGSVPFEEVKKLRGGIAREEERALAAILSPDQKISYERMEMEETNSGPKAWANREASRIKNSLDLTADQMQQVAVVLSDLPPGQGGPRLPLYSDASNQLEVRAQTLGRFLTPQQIQVYRQMVQQDIAEHELMAKITKALKQ